MANKKEKARRRDEKRQRKEAARIFEQVQHHAREMAMRETLQSVPIYQRLMERGPATGRERDPDVPVCSEEGPFYSKPYGIWPFRKRRMWTGAPVIVTLLPGTKHAQRVVLPNPMWASGSVPA